MEVIMWVREKILDPAAGLRSQRIRPRVMITGVAVKSASNRQ
jgi:hypothetical protein